MRPSFGFLVPVMTLTGCATSSPGSVTPVPVIARIEATHGEEAQETRGTLRIYTATDPIDDGGIFYCPHRAYEILSGTGHLLRKVPNHRGPNDEDPMSVLLPPGQYKIRTLAGRGSIDFLVEIETGRLTTLHVERLLARNDAEGLEQDP